MFVFLDSIKTTFRQFKKNWRYLPLVGLFDLIFLFLFGFGTSVLRNIVAEPILNILNQSALLSSTVLQAASDGQSALHTLLSDPTIALNLHAVLNGALVFTALVYAFWVIFDGTSWYLANKMRGDKHDFMNFLKKFSLISLFWIFVFAVLDLALVNVIFSILVSPQPAVNSSTLELLAGILNGIVFYFLFISFSFLPMKNFFANIKQTFVHGIKNIASFGAAFVVIIIVLYIDFKITFLLFQPAISSMTSLNLISIIILLIRFTLAAPILVWARLYLMDVAKKVY